LRAVAALPSVGQIVAFSNNDVQTVRCAVLFLRLALTACSVACFSAFSTPVTVAAADAGAGAKSAGKATVYIGTYTRGNSKGIYVARLDLATGKLTPAELAAEVVNPSFLTLHPSQPLVYAIGEIGNFAGGKSGAVSAFARDAKTGKLTLLNQQSSKGNGPCHVTVDRTGKNVLVANYGSGSVACLPIKEDGSLGEATSFIQHEGSGPNPKRQQGPHAHSINVDAANRFAIAADLGLDKLLVYRFDAAAGKLTPNDPPFMATAPGAGPRHFASHPGGRYAYAINELNSTVTALSYDAERGVLNPLQSISTLPEGFSGNSTTAEVQVHPSGKFVYGSNRGHDSIAAFAVDAATGKLRFVAHEPTQGKTPRNFGIDPGGRYLLAANQDGNNVVVFRIDTQTGKLAPTGSSIEVTAPVCVKILPVAE
jgi:6-phosphogluconolactonase